MRYGDMFLTVETVSPELAAAWLKSNGSNRRARESVIRQYARDMTAGGWVRKPLAICFTSDGVLGNGQHTLSAICRSGMAQELLIARNVPAEAIAAMDRGVRRTVSDVARFLGREIDSQGASVARAVEFGPADQASRSFDELFATYQKHQDAIAFVIEHAAKKQAGFSAPILAVCARAYYTKDRDRIAQFLKVIQTGVGNGPEDSAAIRIRDLAKSLAGHSSSANRIELYQKTQSTLVHFLARKPMTKVYGFEKEQFPVPDEQPLS